MKNWRHHSIFWPLLLIGLGVLLLVNNLGQVSGSNWDTIVKFWPLLLIALGLDGFWRGEGFTAATVVTGLGVIFLLANLNYLQLNGLDLILRLWPIILVAVGLDIILGKRQRWAGVVGVLVGLLVLAGIYWLIASSPFMASFKTEEVSLARDSATSARGTISMPVGKLTLAGTAEGNTLVSGSLKMSSAQTLDKYLSTSGDTATFRLESRGYTVVIPFGSSGTAQEEWQVQLSPTPSYALDCKLAVGEHALDLSGLKVSNLSVQIAVGKTVVTLPASGPLTGKIQSAVGETIVYVPRGASLRVRFERALTSTSQPSDFTRDGNTVTSPSYSAATGIDLTISQAVGMISVRYLP